MIRFAAAADEGADVVACLLPGRLGGVAAAAAMAAANGDEPRAARAARRFRRARPGSRCAAALPLRPVHRGGAGSSAESSAKRVSTYSRTLR